MVLVYHVVYQEYVAKVSNNNMGSRSSRLVTILQSLVAISTMVVET